jgi:hypothetical protein
MTLREWNARLHGLVVFRALLEDPVVAKLVDLTDRMAAGLYGCPCLYLMPRTNHDKNKFVLLKRKFEPYWIDKYYQKGGKLYE